MRSLCLVFDSIDDTLDRRLEECRNLLSGNQARQHSALLALLVEVSP